MRVDRGREPGEDVKEYLHRRAYGRDLELIQGKNTRVVVDVLTREGTERSKEAYQASKSSTQANDATVDALGSLENSVADGLADLGRTLQDLFEEAKEMQEEMHATLRDLLKAGDNPTKTHAYEQFREARDAFKKGLHRDALRFLDCAINGADGVAVGYPVEWRFYALLARVYLDLPHRQDLVAAEAAFLNVVQYAESESKNVAAEAAIQAAWAAYALGKFTDARRHTLRAVNIVHSDKTRLLAVNFAIKAGMLDVAEKEIEDLKRDMSMLKSVLEQMAHDWKEFLSPHYQSSEERSILNGWRSILDGTMPSGTEAVALNLRFQNERLILTKARNAALECEAVEEKEKQAKRAWAHEKERAFVDECRREGAMFMEQDKERRKRQEKSNQEQRQLKEDLRKVKEKDKRRGNWIIGFIIALLLLGAIFSPFKIFSVLFLLIFVYFLHN